MTGATIRDERLLGIERAWNLPSLGLSASFVGNGDAPKVAVRFDDGGEYAALSMQGQLTGRSRSWRLDPKDTRSRCYREISLLGC